MPGTVERSLISTEALIRWLLVSGLVTFMVGAVRWRLEYEQPFELSLPPSVSPKVR